MVDIGDFGIIKGRMLDRADEYQKRASDKLSRASVRAAHQARCDAFLECAALMKKLEDQYFNGLALNIRQAERELKMS